MAHTILFAVDFSDMTDAVLRTAKEAAAERDGASVHAVCVIEDTDALGARRDCTKELAKLEEALGARVDAEFGKGTVTVHARAGKPAQEIADTAASIRADLIVIGRHGHSGPREWLVGTVPTRVLQLARCSVLVVQPTDYPAK